MILFCKYLFNKMKCCKVSVAKWPCFAGPGVAYRSEPRPRAAADQEKGWAGDRTTKPRGLAVRQTWSSAATDATGCVEKVRTREKRRHPVRAQGPGKAVWTAGTPPTRGVHPRHLKRVKRANRSALAADAAGQSKVTK